MTSCLVPDERWVFDIVGEDVGKKSAINVAVFDDTFIECCTFLIYNYDIIGWLVVFKRSHSWDQNERFEFIAGCSGTETHR